MSEYLKRSIDGLISEVLSELPALLLVGPRATGKTTTASRHAATEVRLDRAAEAAAFHADPDAALRGLVEPVMLDEWQEVPELLGAVKRSIDADPHPGRFVLTGSVRADLGTDTRAGTGRLVRVSMFGLTIAEQLQRIDRPPLLDRLVAGEPIDVPADTPDIRGYVELALRSGFPEAALAQSESARQRWIEGYVDQLVMRDALEIEPRRDPGRIRRYFEAYALNSAGAVEEQTLIEAAGINRKTASAYERLLTDLLIVDSLPSWTSNRLKRLVMTPKRYVVDAALLAGVLRLDVAGIMRDGDLLGRVLETLVVSQIRAELPISTSRPRVYHLRERQGRHEIDLLGELPGGRILAIEVKASAAPTSDSAKHLAWLRDRLGTRFGVGVVLHTGPRTYSLGKQILAAPISTLWA